MAETQLKPPRVERFYELTQLAGIYMEDGAWLTAAAKLDEAARILREGEAEFTAALNSQVAPKRKRAS